ncbi:MAG TPA: transglutaminase domain-containing protein, partial [Candidatus Limnocylindrales bacterium]|nr:transglutaminase domain-containing protein [Candidatus Limnocylindrales bacterium]
GAWTDVGARVVEWGQFLERYLPTSRSGRSLGPTFGQTSVIQSVWSTSDQLQLNVDFGDEEFPPFLAGGYYDQFQLRGWTRTQAVEAPRDAGSDVLVGTAEAVDATGRRSLTATIKPAYSRREVFTPGPPTSISSPAKLRLTGDGGYVASIERETTDSQYTVTALVRAEEAEGGWTEERLRAAGTDYPEAVSALYGKGTLPEGAMGPKAAALLDDIVTTSGAANPYDLASAIEARLRDPREFHYDTDVSDTGCVDQSIVECFVITREGFCQYYASTMTVFLRDQGIPARFVEGFLPGAPDPIGTGRTVRNADAHAWVQAYFPGYGWIDFDPTGGPERPQLAPIPSGVPVASGTPKPSSSGSRNPAIPSAGDGFEEGPGGPTPRSTRTDAPIGLLIGIAILLAVAVGSLAAVAWRRGPRGPISPDDAYGSVARLASRLGFGPRPTQTVYEYAGVLGDELPMVRPELETVARAKVEVAYGGRLLTDDRLSALRHAHRRLRVQLLRLVARRSRRKGFRRR